MEANNGESVSGDKIKHVAFKITLLFKGIFALVETLGGIAVYMVTVIGGVFTFFVSQQSLLRFVSAVTQEELTEDPRDFLANYFLHLAQNLSLTPLNFAAFYLVSHGVIKLWLITGLLRKKLWYYPVSIAVFGLFIAYQLYRFSFTHSVWLLFLTAVDAVVIWLTWHEYKYLRRVLPR